MDRMLLAVLSDREMGSAEIGFPLPATKKAGACVPGWIDPPLPPDWRLFCSEADEPQTRRDGRVAILLPGVVTLHYKL